MIDAPLSTREMVLGALRSWADRGWLRRLDATFATFVASLDPDADGAVLVAAALTAHLEGQGHACLRLRDLVDDAAGLLQWQPDAADALRFVLASVQTGAAPGEAGWAAALRSSAVVFADDDAGVDPSRSGAAAADDEAGVGAGEPLVLCHGRLYLRRYWGYERRIADAIVARSEARLPVDVGCARTAIDALFMPRAAAVEAPSGHARNEPAPDWQRIAAGIALRGRLAIVTGGPGTGKTYTAARLIALLGALAPEPSNLRIVLAAPTGKAAARLKQSIDLALAERAAGSMVATTTDEETSPPRSIPRIGAAKTLHALLGTRRGSRHFRHDAGHLLPLDVLIVDEASMIHVEMMAALLAALPADARLVLLGDKDQLASVEAGAVLGELCRRSDAGHYTTDTADAIEAATLQVIPVGVRDRNGTPLDQQTVMLRQSERFGGAIDTLARAVNAGRGDDAIAALDDPHESATAWLVPTMPNDVVAFAEHGRADVGHEKGKANKVDTAGAGYGPFLDVLRRRPDSLFVEDHETWVRAVRTAFDRFRLLCAVREGPWGVAALNRAIEQRFAAAHRLDVAGSWYVGRPVIVARNDYDVGVFNGDIGIALPASPHDPRLRVHFVDGAAIRSVGVSRLADVETAFAMTVHKAQGSEFAHTALVLPPQATRVATRELLYTGITRARTAFTLLAARESLTHAVARTTRRSSGIGAMIAARQGIAKG